MNEINNYQAYLFDLDGTLVQSEKLKGLAISKACKYFGSEIDPNIYKQVMGESWEVVTEYFFNAGGINPRLSEFDQIFKNIYEELIYNDLELSPNITQLLNKLVESGKKIGLVSSASSWMVNQILNQFNLMDYFNVVVTREQVVEHKPHPEAYLLALDKLSLAGEGGLVFEDSNAGIRSAKSAGCEVIAFQHEYNSKNDLSMAIKVITDFKEISV